LDKFAIGLQICPYFIIFNIMIKRILQDKLYALASKFPVVAVLGPRQSGKTTLVRSTFPEKDYQNLEDPETRLFAHSDPRAFLEHHPGGLIIDEAQREPDLFSYLQLMVDEHPIPGQFILTGSQHFLLHEKLSQTLAGRVAILTLLPFSLEELINVVPIEKDYLHYLFMGFYPPIYDKGITPQEWLPNYIQTYVERDVRMLKNITDLNAFTRFLKLCAGRTGQLINYSALATEAGISSNTARSWLSVLEASFIIFFLQPHYKNFNKRLVKMPKLYFYDTGLVVHLLGVQEEQQLEYHYMKGALFENFIISEIAKYEFHRGKRPEIFFWRDKSGREIDCIVDRAGNLFALEIKVSKSINQEFFKNIRYWSNLPGNKPAGMYVIYAGSQIQAWSDIRIVPWWETHTIMKEITRA